ncbi:MAG: hypothetical protein V1722_03970 [Candidatus Micrarchaeota archaeon]
MDLKLIIIGILAIALIISFGYYNGAQEKRGFLTYLGEPSYLSYSLPPLVWLGSCKENCNSTVFHDCIKTTGNIQCISKFATNEEVNQTCLEALASHQKAYSKIVNADEFLMFIDTITNSQTNFAGLNASEEVITPMVKLANCYKAIQNN